MALRCDSLVPFGSPVRRWRGLAGLLVLLVAGCGGSGPAGGGGGGGGAATVSVRCAIAWAARSRATVDAPSAALSATWRLVGAQADGTDVAMTVNRDAAPAAYTQEYTAAQVGRVGRWSLQVRLYAQADGAGNVVGVADAQVELAADGGLMGTITTAPEIATVEVASGLVVDVAGTRELPATARNAAGQIVAVTPGTFTWRLVAGQAFLALASDGVAQGLAAGAAEVEASAGAVASPGATVVVSSAAALPNGFTIGPRSVATLTGAAGQQVTDPAGDVTYGFPPGATGVLQTAPLTAAPTLPVALTGGRLVQLPSAVSFELAFPVPADGEDLAVFVYRQPAAESRSYERSPEACWELAAELRRDGSTVTFGIGEPPGGAARQGGTQDRWVVWNSFRTAPTTAQAKIVSAVDQLLAMMPPGLRETAEVQRLRLGAPRFVPLAAGPSAYKGCYSATPALVWHDPQFQLNQATCDEKTAAHEAGHYLSHVLSRVAGDDRYFAIENLAPPFGAIDWMFGEHKWGDLWLTRRTVTEEYAYFTQYLLNSSSDTDIYSPVTLCAGAHYQDTPLTMDFPSVEGFGTVMMATLSRRETTANDFTGGVAPTPAVGLDTGEVLRLYQAGATTPDELRAAIPRTFAQVTQQQLAVMLERCGWSYHARGRLVDEQGQPIPFVVVQPSAVVAGATYPAGEAAQTTSDGRFVVQRLFPTAGLNTQLTVTLPCTTVNIPLAGGVAPYERLTTAEVDLGDVVARTDLAALLRRCRQVSFAYLGAYVEDLWPFYCLHPVGNLSSTVTSTFDLTRGAGFTINGSGGATVPGGEYRAETFQVTGSLSADYQTLTVSGSGVQGGLNWRFSATNVPLQQAACASVRYGAHGPAAAAVVGLSTFDGWYQDELNHHDHGAPTWTVPDGVSAPGISVEFRP